MQRRLLGTSEDTNLFMRICGRPPDIPIEGQILNALVIFSAVTFFIIAISDALLGIPDTAILIGIGLVFLGLYYLLRFRKASITLCGAIAFALNLMVLTGAWLANAGIDGSAPFFYIPTMIAAMTIFKGRSRLFFVGATVTHFGAMVALQYFNPHLITPYRSAETRYIDMLISFAIETLQIIGFVGIAIYNLEYRRRLADDLLLNILPGVVAEKLKFSPAEVVAQSHDQASILFADVVNFTPLSADLTPGNLVALLNDVFSRFDTLAEKYGVEKIKTIGDGYMVAAGVPHDQVNHAVLLTQLALEMRDCISERKFGDRQLNIRIGINSGPVVAGVIGRKKFIYDLWGDAVNTASRMESHGMSGCIQITEATYELIKNDFVCESHGSITVKGKGEIKVWYVLGEKR